MAGVLVTFQVEAEGSALIRLKEASISEESSAFVASQDREVDVTCL